MPQNEIGGHVYTVEARRGKAIRLDSGSGVAVVNSHGSQVVDTWAFCADSVDHYMSMEHTRAETTRLMPAAGSTLFTNRREPILQLESDTSPGTHDTLIPACDRWRYERLGHVGYHRNCCDNLREALAAIGLSVAHVPSPLNLFMNIPIDKALGLTFAAPASKSGDTVVLRALRPCIVVFSACPQDLVPINGVGMTPRDVHLHLLEAAGR